MTSGQFLAAFCRAGRPQQKVPTWGSFEGWSDLVRQAVVWCGQSDPGATRTELVEQSDREAVALRELLAGWDELDPDRFGMTTAEILNKLAEHPHGFGQVHSAVLELCPAPAGKLPSARSLGNKLGHLRGRVVGGRCLDDRVGRGNRKAWQVTGDAQCGDSGDSGDSPPALPPRVESIGTLENQYEKGPETESPEQPESPKASPCEVCGSGRLWRSHHGPHWICGTCKAPPTESHVAEWIEVPRGVGLHERRARR